jgi:hypothetical protein
MFHKLWRMSCGTRQSSIYTRYCWCWSIFQQTDQYNVVPCKHLSISKFLKSFATKFGILLLGETIGAGTGTETETLCCRCVPPSLAWMHDHGLVKFACLLEVVSCYLGKLEVLPLASRKAVTYGHTSFFSWWMMHTRTMTVACFYYSSYTNHYCSMFTFLPECLIHCSCSLLSTRVKAAVDRWAASASICMHVRWSGHRGFLPVLLQV